MPPARASSPRSRSVGAKPVISTCPDQSTQTLRPEIWAEGRQSPTFDLRAFGRVALGLTRRTVGPKLVTASEPVLRLALRVADGAFAPHVARLGRAGGYLPSRGAAAVGLRGICGLLISAGHIILPVPDDARLAYPELLRPAPKAPRGPVSPPVPQPVRPRRAAPRLGDAVEGPDIGDRAGIAEGSGIGDGPRTPPQFAAKTADEPMLSAIRSLIADREPLTPPPPIPRAAPPPRFEAAPAQPMPQPKPVRRLIPHRWRAAASRSIAHATAFGLGWTITGLVLPYGAVLAAVEHLQGEDLRDWH